ncbi:MAG: MotA/TolQ/ExbB proton channel family protein [Rhodopirellula sp.]|nr:MotA/TolQ/ExbB proton channel family protein [Rhodopirellula sp.]
MSLTESDKTSRNRLRLLVLASGLIFALMPLLGQAQDGAASSEPAVAEAGSGTAMPSLWDLAVQGGLFMIPIGLASIVVVAFTLERLIGLRLSRIMPPEFLVDLRKLNAGNGIDPREAYSICQKHPSPLANAVQAAVLKIGRPHAELEKAVEDAVARESADMARNFRPINVVATIAPLLGLIGTVQGMIQAFMVISSTTSTGTAKAQELAHGIYTALVTTFAGLVVAVIAVLLANFLEGRLDRILRSMEELFLDLIPQFERYEGKLRVSRTQNDESGESGILLKGTARKTQPRAEAEVKFASDDEPVPAGSRPRSLWGVMGEPE